MRLASLVLVLVCALALALADSPPGQARARLSGYNEVPPVYSPGTGAFSAVVDQTAKTIAVTLEYSALAGNAQAAHLHFGQKGVNGAVVVTLCGAGKPACPVKEGTVTLTVGQGDIVAVPAQGIPAGGIDALLDAIDSGAVYVNVHSNLFPSGEIRGQVKPGRGPDDDPGQGEGRGKGKARGREKDDN
ncbi:MAG: CHRD domain-containing protein [Bryobacterales bacterium]|nr:CHRD domain-containing protein [Bryobacterales bacterium]